MKKIKQLARLLHIYHILTKYGVMRLLLTRQRLYLLRFFAWFNPYYWYSAKYTKQNTGAVLRATLEKLGPIFIKFGQALSVRQDLFSENILQELAKLQDQVHPFSSEKARYLVERALKKPIDTLFANFSDAPLASASIAQVHAARLFNQKAVVVKIRRPRILHIIQRDIALLYFAARLLVFFWPKAKRLRPTALVSEFEQTILDELDFMREAANASQLRRHFQHSKLLYVPQIHWAYTTDCILVMERIFATPISDLETMQKKGVNLSKLSQNGVEIFLTQVFQNSFFHADMHPGNVFVCTKDPDNPRYMAVDFGIMGSLSAEDQHYLAENLLAFFRRNYRRVALLHVESGWVKNNTRVECFEAAIRTVCEPIFERPLKDISFAQLLIRLFQTAERFHMEVQPQLFLLQKTLLNIESLGRKLDPELNLWESAQPFLERWVKQRYAPHTLLKKWLKQIPYHIESSLASPAIKHQKQTCPTCISIKEPAPKKQGSRMLPFLMGMLVMGVIGVVMYVYF